MFPLKQVSGNIGQDTISKKKLESGKFQWAVRKEVLGWMVDDATWFIGLMRYNKSSIDAELRNIVRMTKGVPFKQIEKLIGKIQHAATSVPKRGKLMTSINKILQVKPQIVWWKYLSATKQAF